MENQPINSSISGTAGLSVANTGGKQPEGTLMQHETRDKAPVNGEQLASQEDRTLEARYPPEETGDSSPPIRHHKEERLATEEDVRELLKEMRQDILGRMDADDLRGRERLDRQVKSMTDNILAEAFETIDSGTAEFTGQLAAATQDIKKIHTRLDKVDASLDKLDARLDKLERTIDNGTQRICEAFKSYNAMLDAHAERFAAGLEEDRATGQRILKSMAESNAHLKEINALTAETAQLLEDNNARHAKKLAEIHAKLEAPQGGRTTSSQPSGQTPAGTGASSRNAPSTEELRASLRAKREALEQKHRERKNQ